MFTTFSKGPCCLHCSSKCDTHLDCQDETDENDCDYLKMPKNYAKELIPGTVEGKSIQVKMNLSFLAFPVIDTAGLKFTVDFYLQMSWHDNRLTFRDLNEASILNTLNSEDRDNIWVPRIA